MKINFRAFTAILVGMTLIGCAIGFLVGYYFHMDLSGKYWMYIASPVLGIGSGLVMYGALFKERT